MSIPAPTNSMLPVTRMALSVVAVIGLLNSPRMAAHSTDEVASTLILAPPPASPGVNFQLPILPPKKPHLVTRAGSGIRVTIILSSQIVLPLFCAPPNINFTILVGTLSVADMV